MSQMTENRLRALEGLTRQIEHRMSETPHAFWLHIDDDKLDQAIDILQSQLNDIDDENQSI